MKLTPVEMRLLNTTGGTDELTTKAKKELEAKTNEVQKEGAIATINLHTLKNLFV